MDLTCLYVFLVQICLCAMCVPGVHKDPKRVSNPVAEVTDDLLTTMWVLETKLRFAGGTKQNKTKKPASALKH